MGWHKPKKPVNSIGNNTGANTNAAKEEKAKHTGKYYGGMIPTSQLPDNHPEKVREREGK